MLLLKVCLYICIKIPKRAKKLYKEIVSKTVDEYLDFIGKAKNQDDYSYCYESCMACS